MSGASVADKVVGKEAAALMVQGGVRAFYTDLISESAHALLVGAGVQVNYKQIVHHIENRDKTDWCPLEKSCKGEEPLYLGYVPSTVDDEAYEYFCKPYHSWERGANENTNGLIKQYIPKGTDFSEVTNKQIKRIENILNNRPRKRLGYLTPNEKFKQIIHQNSVAFAS